MDIDHLGDNIAQGISIEAALASDEEINGTGRRNSKRKGRALVVNEQSSSELSESDAPLVCRLLDAR